jgi:4-amino-4-deoxy-L-arabinose transferase-like glycosyltransferase
MSDRPSTDTDPTASPDEETRPDTCVGRGTFKLRSKTAWIVLGCLAAASLAVRLLILSASAEGYWEQYEVRYDEVARNLVAGRGFAETEVMDLNISELAGTGPFLAPRPPLYPTFLAAVYRILGRHPWAVGGMQALLSTAAGLLCFAAGRRLFGHRVGLLAAAMSLLYPYHIYHDLWLGDAALAGLFVMLWLTLSWAYARRGGWRLLAALGIVLGLAVLLRPAYALLLFASALWLRWGLAKRWRAVAGATALMTAAAGCVLLPWTIRNYRVFDRLVPLCTYSGYAFWVGNNPITEHCLRTGIEVDQPRLVLLSLIGDSLRGLDELEQQRWFYGQGIEFIRSEPQAFLRLIPWKVWRFWGWDVYPRPAQSLRTVAHAATYLPLAALAVLGLVKGFRARSREISLLLILYACVTLFHFVFYSYTRYRKPFDHTLAVLAGYGLVVALSRRGPSRPRTEPG